MEENLQERWEAIERRNILRYNNNSRKRKIIRILILTAMILVNIALTSILFINNRPMLGIPAVSFGIIISGLYFHTAVKPALNEPDRIYDPALNPMA